MGDYLFQTKWMATKKAKEWIPLLVHCMIYTVVITILVYLGYGWLPMGAIALIFGSHILLDQRTFISWWVKHIMKAEGKEASWLQTMADQTFHLIILGIIAHIWF